MRWRLSALRRLRGSDDRLGVGEFLVPAVVAMFVDEGAGAGQIGPGSGRVLVMEQARAGQEDVGLVQGGVPGQIPGLVQIGLCPCFVSGEGPEPGSGQEAEGSELCLARLIQAIDGGG